MLTEIIEGFKFGQRLNQFETEIRLGNHRPEDTGDRCISLREDYPQLNSIGKVSSCFGDLSNPFEKILNKGYCGDRQYLQIESIKPKP